MRIDFTGKAALITGGSGGIGFAVARALSGAGAEITIVDMQPPPELPPGARFIESDVSQRESLEKAMDHFEALDVVVANAGIGRQALLTETDDALWARTLAVNLTGVFLTVQLAARKMKPRRAGSIVITASTNSYDGEANLTAYNATKAGVLGILHTAANELGQFGIRVNAVCPGLIRTPLTKGAFDSPDILREYFRHMPLGRGGEPREVANAVAFLASDLASYITGAALLVDGGQMASKFGLWNEENAEFHVDRWTLK
jgi:NAD(P)-dependent dehydrogenase (short-subunit alcohol dehydrogenase family)